MRIPVELPRCYRLLNHGPTTLITTANEGRANVMAAAWVMPLDFTPPKVAVVFAQDTYTRFLVDATGEFAINVPPRALAELTQAVGSVGGREVDKIARYSIATFSASMISVPLVEKCVAWLECRVISEPAIQQSYDLFVAEVVAAWADDRVFSNGKWHFPDEAHRTLHHVSGGSFFVTGNSIELPRPDETGSVRPSSPGLIDRPLFGGSLIPGKKKG
jgi:flavin reductase (DIM6/NTAB) family NADH-FMN oxidoreductase RutF